MKRHESLIPISRQHHGGLLTARLLQHGAPPYKGMPTTPEAKRDYVLSFWETHLKPHFRLEEETVFILASEASEVLAQQAKHFQEQHKLLENLILALPAIPINDLSDKLHETGKLLEQHIRQEERIFFEQLQQELPENKLYLLQQLVQQHLR